MKMANQRTKLIIVQFIWKQKIWWRSKRKSVMFTCYQYKIDRFFMWLKYDESVLGVWENGVPSWTVLDWAGLGLAEHSCANGIIVTEIFPQIWYTQHKYAYCKRCKPSAPMHRIYFTFFWQLQPFFSFIFHLKIDLVRDWMLVHTLLT